MKKTFILFCLTLFAMACSHVKKESYSPIVNFIDEGKTFQAAVHLPKEFKEKLPLVVIVPEWWGKTSYVDRRGQMLNDEGYATLVVDMYGNNEVVESPTEAGALATPFYKNPEIGIARLTKYIEAAKLNPHVDASKIYVIGYCFGGTQALNLARSGADIKGVVSFHGGLTSTLISKGIKANVLAINGLADPFVPAKDREAFNKEMKAIKANVKVVNYADATHAFTNPEATAKGKKYNIPVAYNKKADEGSWKDLLNFLKK